MNEITAIALLCTLTDEQMERFKDVLVALTSTLQPNGPPESQAQVQEQIQKNIAEADQLCEQAMRFRGVLSRLGA